MAVTGSGPTAADPAGVLTDTLSQLVAGRIEVDAVTGAGRSVSRDATGLPTRAVECGVSSVWTFSAGVPVSVTQTYAGTTRSFSCTPDGLITGVR